jgi:hypothetical protein
MSLFDSGSRDRRDERRVGYFFYKVGQMYVGVPKKVGTRNKVVNN